MGRNYALLLFFFFTFCFLGSKGLKSLVCFFSSFEVTEDNVFTVLHGGLGDNCWHKMLEGKIVATSLKAWRTLVFGEVKKRTKR